MVGREGFEPPKRYAARLQRVDLTNGRADPGREDGASRKLHAIYSVVKVHGRIATMRWLPRGSALRGDARMYWVVIAQECRESNSVDEGFGGPPATSASLLWIA